MAESREVLTWQDFGSATRELAQMVADDGYRADIVLCIARGGLLAAGAMSYGLNVKNVHVMNIMFYTGVDQRMSMPVVLPPVPNAIDLRDSIVLIVDDVADTGATLKVVHDFCAGHVAEARCAVLYEKPHSLVKCEYVWRQTDRWIEFPWSNQEPVVGSGVRDA